MKHTTTTLTIALLISLGTIAQDITEWRGPGRTGVFDETGLMQVWPENGPELLWETTEVPEGWASFSVAHNSLFTTGRIDSMEYVIALGLDGSKLWQTEYGKAWNDSYPESRSTPTVDDDRLYVASGLGDVACLNALSGEIIWKVEASKKFEGIFGHWGISESLIVLDDKVFFTPAGKKTTMVALDKMTGETIWMSESLDDEPAYVSPLLIKYKRKQQVVNVTKNYVFAVNPKDGAIIWKFDFGAHSNEKGWNIQCNTPLYDDGRIFITAGYNHNCVMLELNKKGNDVSLAWENDVLDVHHGGVVKVGDYIYGPNWEHNKMGHWVCLDWESGEVKYETEWGNKGPIISAEGMLYCYEEKKGNIALVEANPEKFEVISSFQLPKAKKKAFHWCHPIIHNGVFYVRHADVVRAYDIKE